MAVPGLHVEELGTGTPTVVFEAGLGASRAMWGGVVPAVAERTRTIVYDRAGLGRSPAVPGPRDLEALVEDHLRLLASLGPGPFVLVGHSWGGPIVRVVASRVPDLVAGLVLVDQTDELCDLYFTPKSVSRSASAAKMLSLLARLGVLKLIAKRTARHLPEPAASVMRTEDGTGAAAATQAAELVGSIDDMRRLLADPPVLPDVPVVVISGTKRSRTEPSGQREALVAAHKRRADEAPQGRWVEAAGSSHLVPLTEPDLVAAEVLRLL